MDKKGPFWVFLDWNSKKLMSYLKSAPSSSSKYQKSSEITTTITATTKNGTKNDLKKKKKTYLGILARKFEKLKLYLKSTSSNLPKYKNLFKTKREANLGSKMPYLGILGCKFEKPLIYLKSMKSDPSNLSKCKVSCKNKIVKGTLM